LFLQHQKDPEKVPISTKVSLLLEGLVLSWTLIDHHHIWEKKELSRYASSRQGLVQVA
jgi:hypothetical protein